jgi:hypothetical protein
VSRVAVSGHRGLAPEVACFVDQAIRDYLARIRDDSPLVGLSCLADGADQIFARAVLDLGGDLEVIVPARQYRDGLPAQARSGYDELIARASRVHRLERIESTSAAHMEASIEMLKLADYLVAVWDGQPARAFGGTADVVAAAREHGIPVTVIWPEGATRD